MSYYMYLASDQPLPEVKSPHYTYMSINEAAAAGLKMPDYLSGDGIDRDKPDVVVWCDITPDQEDSSFTDDDFDIFPIEKFEDILTQKEYCCCLELSYSDGRARNVIAYIREQLKQADTVEIWNIDLSEPELPRRIKRVKIAIDDLDVPMIKKLYHASTYSYVSVSRPGTVLKEMGIEDEELEVSIQHCYEITR